MESHASHRSNQRHPSQPKDRFCPLSRRRVMQTKTLAVDLYFFSFFIYADDRMFSPFIKRPTPWMHTLGFVVAPDLSRRQRQ